jgi:hypothetical protein
MVAATVPAVSLLMMVRYGEASGTVLLPGRFLTPFPSPSSQRLRNSHPGLWLEAYPLEFPAFSVTIKRLKHPRRPEERGSFEAASGRLNLP